MVTAAALCKMARPPPARLARLLLIVELRMAVVPPMPRPDRIGGDGDHVRHLPRLVSEMQQADGNRSLAHFRMG
jgi:hypothetical protein